MSYLRGECLLHFNILRHVHLYFLKITRFFNINTVSVSSIVDDGIGGVLYILRKDLTSTKSTKNDFLHRCSYAHKKHKALNKRLSSP